MIAPFSMEVRYVHHCTFCDRDEVQAYYVAAGAPYHVPKVPQGWRQLDGHLVCERHDINVTVAKGG